MNYLSHTESSDSYYVKVSTDMYTAIAEKTSEFHSPRSLPQLILFS